MKQKYLNKKIKVDGIIFDSKKEYKRFLELQKMEEAGEITDLKRQVEFVLIPAQCEVIERYSEKTGKRLKDGKKTIEQKCSYYADFTYIKNGELIVEDTKGMRTTDYIIKRKLMLFVHQLKINEI